MRSTRILLVAVAVSVVAAYAAIVAAPVALLLAVPLAGIAVVAGAAALAIVTTRRDRARAMREITARVQADPSPVPQERPPAWVIARREQHDRSEVLRLEEVDGDRVRLVLPGSAAPHDPPHVGEQVHMIDDYSDDTVELWTVDTWDSEEFGDAVIQEGRLVEEFRKRAGQANDDPSWPTG